MLLLTRPQADSEKIQHRLASLGINSLIDPLLTMLTHIPPSQDIASAMDAPALLFTSKNAIPAVAAFPALLQKTLYCVGNATATTAKQHGFQNIAFVAPTVQALLTNLTIPVYYFRGEHITQPLPPKFLTGESIVYSANAAENLSARTLTHIKNATINAVGLWSARTAEIFVKLMLHHAQQTRLPFLTLFCLSHATAAAHPLLAQARCVISPSPDTESLLQTIIAQGNI
jgi:uroporphyrinogen-III synthase